MCKKICGGLNIMEISQNSYVAVLKCNKLSQVTHSKLKPSMESRI